MNALSVCFEAQSFHSEAASFHHDNNKRAVFLSGGIEEYRVQRRRLRSL